MISRKIWKNIGSWDLGGGSVRSRHEGLFTRLIRQLLCLCFQYVLISMFFLLPMSLAVVTMFVDSSGDVIFRPPTVN